MIHVYIIEIMLEDGEGQIYYSYYGSFSKEGLANQWPNMNIGDHRITRSYIDSPLHDDVIFESTSDLDKLKRELGFI